MTLFFIRISGFSMHIGRYFLELQILYSNFVVFTLKSSISSYEGNCFRGRIKVSNKIIIIIFSSLKNLLCQRCKVTKAANRIDGGTSASSSAAAAAVAPRNRSNNSWSHLSRRVVPRPFTFRFVG